MKEMLNQIRQTALEKIAAGEDLEQIRIQYLGKKGELTAVLRGMGKLTAEERPVIGQLANDVRAEIEAKIEAMTAERHAREIEEKLEARSKELEGAALGAKLREEIVQLKADHKAEIEVLRSEHAAKIDFLKGQVKFKEEQMLAKDKLLEAITRMIDKERT